MSVNPIVEVSHPEPWTVKVKRTTVPIGGSPAGTVFEILILSGKNLVAMLAPDKIEDAERIVACINACQGIPTELLQLLAVGDEDGKGIEFCRAYLHQFGHHVS